MLEQKHLDGAQILVNRKEIISRLPKGGVFVEVGVAYGDFSKHVMDTVQPAKFIAVDTFILHKKSKVWGESPKVRLGSSNHDAWFRTRFRSEIEAGKMEVFSGRSDEQLPSIPDGSADVVYIDASHGYLDVWGDLHQAKRILKPGGMIICNDYICYDHHNMGPYGVVQAVNEFLVTYDWRIKYLALHPEMYCDVALVE